MVCNLHFPTGTSEFRTEGHFRGENLTSFMAGLHSKQAYSFEAPFEEKKL